jgi:hypothetical protein
VPSVLRGIIVGGDLESELLVRATDADVRKFSAKAGMAVAVSHAQDGTGMNLGALCGATLYDAGGHPVAVVRSLNVNHHEVDITPLGAYAKQYVAGLMSYELTAMGPV